ncbi:MAG: DEAD/DEAH box helicase [Gammaproteobacteria bacterium]
MTGDALQQFHPAVRDWFEKTFSEPTPAQTAAWPAVKQGKHTLIAAPTGSGKTLAAFLAVIDDLVREGLEHGLADETHVLYVSPLKALSNDIQINLQQPLCGIADSLNESGLPDPGIRSLVRTGDTPQAERERMRREPPHILVTTPESLFILLTSDSGRRMLSTVRSVIVDEIHAVATNKRGSHLALSLERLEALAGRRLTRIGLSATQRPVEEVARFLMGNRDEECTIIDTGHVRERDLAVEIPGSPLDAVMAGEVWQEVYDRLAELINEHKTTLIFVNTRRLAERAARFLGERLGEENVTSHHGSLAREHRLDAEQKLKAGKLRALVATASLELGIDIGDVDLVCQLGSPRSIAALLQRVGRSGHQWGGLPRGRLFPLSRDDLVECAALLDAVRRDELDLLRIPAGHQDVLAQQIIAELACGERDEEELFAQMTRAWPYRDLTRDRFDALITMLAEGFTTRRGRRSRYLYLDAVNNKLKPRKGAKLTAVTNAGAIPDQFDYDVVLEPAGLFIGTLNEDFAFESLPGDIFQLGNTSYRILKVETGKVRVEDARGQPPNIPFWFGEAPGRSDELSLAVSRLRGLMDEKLGRGMTVATAWLEQELGLASAVAGQLVDYLAATRAALGRIPTQEDMVFERFFDDAGDQHLVVHSPYGSRVNRAWGLALRKRFCRQFNFELQAAALEDTIVLSLGATHSFPLEEATRYVRTASVRDTVIQAMLAAPMFMTHWRWNATIALAVRRNNTGRRVPPQFQRMDAEDLMAVVFPDQLACQENLAGEREVPDHPLVNQTVSDCLNEVMDIESLETILQRLEHGKLRIHCKDLSAPSPIAREILTARPYAFLDDAPAEERRTRAVTARGFTDPADAAELGRLNPEAVQQVREEAWPAMVQPDELHDALMLSGFLTEEEVTGSVEQLKPLMGENRAAIITFNEQRYWCSAERLPLLLTVFPDAGIQPSIRAAGPAAQRDWTREEALRELIRARLEVLGPVTESTLIKTLQCSLAEIQTALLALEQEGFVMRGHFTTDAEAEWCERGLLARMHRYTIQSLRKEVRPVAAADFMHFLFHWHSMGEIRSQGDDALAAVMDKLEGCSIAAGAWERDILPARIRNYNPAALDRLCSTGRLLWTRLQSARTNEDRNSSKATLLRNTPLSLLDREAADHWRRLQSEADTPPALSSSAQAVYEVLQKHGALFFIDIVRYSGQLRSQAEEALAELAARGLVTSDSFAGLRALIVPSGQRPRFGGRGRRRRRGAAPARGIDDPGRWSLITTAPEQPAANSRFSCDMETLEYIAHALLRRYGVVFRRVLERETLLPPWRELLYVYRRMEARGEVRGGRFVEGFSGEQFALPEAVGLLRKKQVDTEQAVIISATDPLNLIGIILPGERVPALLTNRIVFQDGRPVACLLNDKLEYLEEINERSQWHIRQLLTQRSNPAGYHPSPARIL